MTEQLSIFEQQLPALFAEAAPLRFVIPGEPVAKGRPRACVIKGMARLYTPKETKEYEERVMWMAKSVMQGKPPLENALAARIQILVSIPKSYSAKKHRSAIAGFLFPAKRPDTDNFVKAILDGLNEIVYRDDAQIVDLYATKRYAADPGVIVEIYPIGEGA